MLLFFFLCVGAVSCINTLKNVFQIKKTTTPTSLKWNIYYYSLSLSKLARSLTCVLVVSIAWSGRSNHGSDCRHYN